MENQELITEFSESVKKIKEELHKDIVGQEEVIDDVVIAVIAGGNVLLEGVPGTGKTRRVRSLGQTLNLPFSRIQFTPDLMPNDVTGQTSSVKTKTETWSQPSKRDLSSHRSS